MSTLRLYFLGTLDIRYDDQPLPKPATLKSQSLLAYLILHRHQPQPRERLVGLFWGDRPEHRARSSLSTALWHIRRCLPHEGPALSTAEGLILSDPHTVQFDPQADLWLDVDEFESHLSHDDMARLPSAVALYRGDFLDGFYDDWIINERYRLETLFCEALARLMAAQEARGEHEAALSTALRLLEQDPLREDAHRLAMRAYCRLGQRNVALEQYRRCREVVGEDLGAEPMVETTELYQAILEGRYSTTAVSGPLKGGTFDAGKFWFEGTQLKFESTEGCLTAQGETKPCIGAYQVHAIEQRDKPALKFVVVEDQYADRKLVLHNRKWSLVEP